MSSFTTNLLLALCICYLAQESQGAPSSVCQTGECLAPVNYSHHKVAIYHKDVDISHFPTRECYKYLRATCTNPVDHRMGSGTITWRVQNVKSMQIQCDAETQTWKIPSCTRIKHKQVAAVFHKAMKLKRFSRGARPRECKDPWIRNGYIRGRAEHPHRVGSRVYITCLEGYTFTNTGSKYGDITCNTNGHWSQTPENVCVASGCRHPGSLDSGSVELDRGRIGTSQLYPFGTTAKFSCDSHHTLFGSSSKTCKQVGNGPKGHWRPYGTPICMWVAKNWGW